MTEQVVIDLTSYKERIGQRVVPGRYTVVVEDAEIDTAKSGNQMINLWLRVLNGTYEGSTLTDRLVITEKSLFRVVAFMQAIGLPTPKKRLAVNLRNFIGKTLDVDVDDGEPYNGRVRSEVRGYMRIEGAAARVATDVADLSDVAGYSAPEDGGTSDEEAIEPDLSGLDEFKAKTEEAKEKLEAAKAAVTPAAAPEAATASADPWAAGDVVDLDSLDL